MRVIITIPQILGNQSVYDDLANLHATLSSSGGEGRGEEVINLGSTTSSSALSGTFSSRGGEGFHQRIPVNDHNKSFTQPDNRSSV
jgi:hypothetical protein